ncbi:MAG: DoxX family protein [Vicinamibacterales bacterium]
MRKNVTLWVVQGLLAALFLFAGVMKLVLPVEAMAGPVALPGLFLRFVGVCESLGAIGLVLPGSLRIHRELTPLAAAGLVVIMVGATVVTAMGGSITAALVPFVVGVLAASVAFGRTRSAQPALAPPVFLTLVAAWWVLRPASRTMVVDG